MMTHPGIYSLRADSRGAWFAFGNDEVAKLYARFNGQSLAESWRELPVVRVEGDEKAAKFDCAALGTLVLLSARAREHLDEVLGATCEFLPVLADSERMFVMNVTTVINALDEERSSIRRFADGGVREVQRYSFRWALLEEARAFRLPQLLGPSFFLTQTVHDTVEREGLSGFVFERVG